MTFEFSDSRFQDGLMAFKILEDSGYFRKASNIINLQTSIQWKNFDRTYGVDYFVYFGQCRYNIAFRSQSLKDGDTFCLSDGSPYREWSKMNSNKAKPHYHIQLYNDPRDINKFIVRAIQSSKLVEYVKQHWNNAGRVQHRTNGTNQHPFIAVPWKPMSDLILPHSDRIFQPPNHNPWV